MCDEKNAPPAKIRRARLCFGFGRDGVADANNAGTGRVDCIVASFVLGYLVDPASSHMLVSKIKPCMSKYKRLYCETANGSLNQLWFI